MSQNAIKGEAGFTLFEMLVATALMGIVFVAISNFFMQGSRLSAKSNSRSEMQQDLLTTQQVISSRLKEAFYVYPPGSLISLPQRPGHPTKNPNTSGSSWTVNTDSILAMVLPPAAGTNTYRFFAYYPVLRATWVNETSDPTVRAKNPGADVTNDAAWVLAEYRATIANYAPRPFDRVTRRTASGALDLAGTLIWSTPNAIGTPINDWQVNLLADYIAPATTADPLFKYRTQNVQSVGGNMTVVTSVSLNIKGRRIDGGKVEASAESAVSLPNLGRLPVP